MRNFRRQYDPRRILFYRQYLGQRDQRYYPDNITPRSNTSVPYPRSNVEAVVSRTMDAFFSIDPAIETRGRGPEDEAAAPGMQRVLLTMLDNAAWINALEILVRNIAIYGFSGIKVDWDWDYDTVTAPDALLAMQPVIDPMTQQPMFNQDGTPSLMPIPNPMTGEPIRLGTRIVTKTVPRNRMKLYPIDVFDLLVDPDGRQAAHMFEKPWAQIQREAQANPQLYLPEGLQQLADRLKDEENSGAILVRMAEYWNEVDNTRTLITFGEDSEAVSWKNTRYSYRNASYSAYKQAVDGGSPILLQHEPNPFIHKRIPILFTSYTKLTGEPFGIGIIEAVSELSESLNKFCNMIADNWNIGINRRYAYDTNADIDHQALNMMNTPGGKVGVNGNPSDVIMPLPTMVPTPAEFSIMDLYKQMIELSSGISDFYGKGVGSSGGNRTATGIGQVISESNYIFKMFIRNFENDILRPMLKMCSSMVMQYCTDMVEYQITDAPPGIPKVGRIPIEQIVGNFEFDFVGANYATNKTVRQRQLMAFYQLASQTPYANQGEFLREMGKVMEIPNCSRLVKPDQQVQQEQMQQLHQNTQMAVLEKLMDTESKMLVAEVAKKDPNTVTAHAREIQDEMEAMLVEAGELVPGAPPRPGKKEGRPATKQPEGKIPGGGHMSAARSSAQQNGANATGMAGMGEMGGTE